MRCLAAVLLLPALSVHGLRVQDPAVVFRDPDCLKRCPSFYSPVCGTNGRTYTSLCELQNAACLNTVIRLKHDGKCLTPQVAANEAEEEEEVVECPENKCSSRKSLVCGTDGRTYRNKCKLQLAACQPGAGLALAYRGHCTTVPVRTTAEVQGCEVCQRIFRPVCGSDGLTYTNRCELQASACRAGERTIVFVRDGACQEGDVVNTGVEAKETPRTWLGGVSDEVAEAAEAGVRQLAGRLGAEVHYTLDYVEEAEEEAGGARYRLTVQAAPSACSLAEPYSRERCPVSRKDDSLRCELVVELVESVKDGSGWATANLVQQLCSPAFDFRAVCLGCPPEGTEAAESAMLVAQFVVRELTMTAAQAGVIGHHLSLIGLRRFLQEADGQGGLHYVVEVEVAESSCLLEEEYDLARCGIGGQTLTRLCTAEVQEAHESRKLGRGVEVRRIEVTSTICKAPPVDLLRAASLDDPDVIEVAKAVTLEVGASFGPSLWLVTRLVAAERREAEAGTEYSLTVAMAASNCLREQVEGSLPGLLYGGRCIVEPGAATKTCQLVVRREVVKYSAVGPEYRHHLTEQVCAERRVCPTSCPDLEEPICGTDGRTHRSPCHLQLASCAAPALPPLAVAAAGHCSRQAELLRDTILCSGCPQDGSRENTAVREAALAATLALGKVLNSSHHFALDSITEAKTQVVAGTNYFLTVIVGESDCPSDGSYSEEDCVINLEHDNNLQCRVVVYAPLNTSRLLLSQHACAPVPVAPHVRRDCNRKCKKQFAPVCGARSGGDPTTFLNICLMEASACIAQTNITLVAEAACELDPAEAEEAAGRAVLGLQDSFPGGRRWAVGRVQGAVHVPGGVRVTLGLRETQCAKTARAGASCPGRAGTAERRCLATVRRGGAVRDVACQAGRVSACLACGAEEVALAKWAVQRVAARYAGTGQWALEHLAEATRQVVEGRYVKHSLKFHMTESTCSRDVRELYSRPECLLRRAAPDNYCEVTVLQSLRSGRRRVSRRSCASYSDMARFF